MIYKPFLFIICLYYLYPFNNNQSTLAIIMTDLLIAEATECDFKALVETQKPKSWLKSVSAFANGMGGTLYFGVDDDRNIVGLSDTQKDAESISRLIKDRISPLPNFVLIPKLLKGREILILKVLPGSSTPYFYKADGKRETYIRVGNESVIAPQSFLNQLLLKGMNLSFDALVTTYDFKDFSFGALRRYYKLANDKDFDDKFFESFSLRDRQGKLTNAGLLLADEGPLRHSRIFCTRWRGISKAGGLVDSIDNDEFVGSLFSLLKQSCDFIKSHTNTMRKKLDFGRVDLPDYSERSYYECLVNALVHRDYSIVGSEIHIDIYDDRMTIYSPGGMVDGRSIQDVELKDVSSVRRNPYLADVLSQLELMERQGSGLRKIVEYYRNCPNYTAGKDPVFFSDTSQFLVTLPNLNYGVSLEELLAKYDPKRIATIGSNVMKPIEQKPGQQEQKSGLQEQKSGLQEQKSGLQEQKSGLQEQKSGLQEQKSGLQEQKSGLQETKTEIIEDPLESSDKFNVIFEPRLSQMRVNKNTKLKIQALFAKFGYQDPFRRRDVVAITGLSNSNASELIRKMHNGGLVKQIASKLSGEYLFVK